jgi:hypothetical protein
VIRSVIEYGPMVQWYWEGKTEVPEEKPAPVSICLPHNPHRKLWDWNQASVVRGRRLIAPTASSKFSNHLVQRLVQNTYSAVQCASRIRNFIAVTTKACHESLAWIRSIHFHILSQPSPTCVYVRTYRGLGCRITVRLKTRLSPCSSQHKLSLSRKCERL